MTDKQSTVVVSNVIAKLRMAQCSSCSCLTKTNDPARHKEDCLYRVLSEAIAILAATPETEQPANDDQERAAFERAEHGSYLARDETGDYENMFVQAAYEGWIARAALSSPDQSEQALDMVDQWGEVVAYWSDWSMVSVRGDGVVRTYTECCAPVSHAQPPNKDALAEQLQSLISAVRSINHGPRHAHHMPGDDEPCYLQRKEWVEWVLGMCDESEAALTPITLQD